MQHKKDWMGLRGLVEPIFEVLSVCIKGQVYE